MKRGQLLRALLLVAIVGHLLANSFINNKQIYAANSNKGYINYTVQSGDCLSTIAEKYKGQNKLSNEIAEIEYLNNVFNDIQVGQILKVPVGD